MYGFIEKGNLVLDNTNGHLNGYRILGLPNNIQKMTNVEIEILSKIYYGCFKDEEGNYRIIHKCVPGCDVTKGVFAAVSCEGNALYRDGTRLHLNYMKTNEYNSWSSAISSFLYHQSKNSYGLDIDDKTIFCGRVFGEDVYWDTKLRKFISNKLDINLPSIKPIFPLFDPEKLLLSGKSFVMISSSKYIILYKNGKYKIIENKGD